MCDISRSFLTLLWPQLYHNLETLSLKTLRFSLPTFNDLCSPLVLQEHSFCQSVLTSSWPCAFSLLCLQHSSLQFFLLLLWLLCSVDLLGFSLIPSTEEPGGLQSMGPRRVRHDWATSLSLFTFTHWRRKWQPTPVFLPGESQGQGSLVGCCLWGRTESDTTEAT